MTHESPQIIVFVSRPRPPKGATSFTELLPALPYHLQVCFLPYSNIPHSGGPLTRNPCNHHHPPYIMHSRTDKETRFLDAVDPIIPARAIHHSTPLTLNPFRLSTTQARRASRPTVTVTLAMGSANWGYDASFTETKSRSQETVKL